MATTKTSTLAFRIELGLKEALITAVQQGHRSIDNMVGVLIRDYCERNGIESQEALSLTPDKKKLNDRKRG